MMYTGRGQWRGWTVALLAIAWAGGAGAQGAAAQTVLHGGQVTESALVDALAIGRPEEAAGGKTRSFRPAAPRPADRPAAAPGRANLLMTFATNSSELNGETRKTLDVLARALQSDTLASRSFKIEGHADARGDVDSNHTLSQARAEAVAGYLVQQHHIQADRLVPVGKGSSEPLNASRADAPENRRVTIVTVRN